MDPEFRPWLECQHCFSLIANATEVRPFVRVEPKITCCRFCGLLNRFSLVGERVVVEPVGGEAPPGEMVA